MRYCQQTAVSAPAHHSVHIEAALSESASAIRKVAQGSLGKRRACTCYERWLWLCRKWFAVLVAALYTVIGVMAAIGAVRSIVMNAVTYHIFANL